ncbi:MAG: hotdog fold thioesterase [Chitinophagales bacterium]|nr:hotdog fold thioesterase [Chitinophagales bacterium]
MKIWHSENISLADLQARSKNTIVAYIDIVYTEIGDDYIKATMPVDHRTQQPMGLLHGGASVVLAESLGSVAANLCLDNTKQYAVGLDINSNHLKSATKGLVEGIVKPIHIGSKTAVWEIKIYDERQKIINISRLTTIVLDRK